MSRIFLLSGSPGGGKAIGLGDNWGLQAKGSR